MILASLASLSVLSWLYILIGRGGFWRVGATIRDTEPADFGQASVVAVVPARDEADVIEQSIPSLLNQDYRPTLHVVLVDDASTDNTAELARRAAAEMGRSDRLTVVASQPLPPGWTGKLWALSQGVEEALRLEPDYLLFTDADILHGAAAIRKLVGKAKENRCDLASLMVTLACASPAEKALIPAFVFFFLQLYPPAWIRSPKAKTAGAAGGCILIRPQALERIGGIAAIRDAVIDDCTLAQAVKKTGGHLWMGLTAETRSIRSYGSVGEIGTMISRTAFSQLNHSALLLGATVLGLFVTYLVPPLAACSGRRPANLIGVLAWLLMAAAYLPTVRYYRQSSLWCVTLPAVACFYLGATVFSAIQYWRGKGGRWKGRVQDARA